MSSLKEKRFLPDPDARAVYDELYAMYRELHDAFGGVAPGDGLGTLMKRLLALKERATRSARDATRMSAQ
jgi:L-ribulokinase